MVLGLLLALVCTQAAPAPSLQEKEAAAIKELKPKLRSKDAAERGDALVRLVELDRDHPDAPSVEIAELIAGALGDDSADVRSQAARLLVSGRHPDVAVRSLLGALDQVRKELSKSGGGGGRPGGGGATADPKDPRVAEQRRQREELMKFGQAVVEGLGKLPDDRCVEALAEFLPQLGRRNGGELAVTTAQSLLNFEARAGVEAVVQKIKLTAGDAGGKWGPDPTAKSLHDLLMRVASDLDLEGMPLWSEKDPPDWDRWLAKNQKQFKAKLGKYDLERMRKGPGG